MQPFPWSVARTLLADSCPWCGTFVRTVAKAVPRRSTQSLIDVRSSENAETIDSESTVRGHHSVTSRGLGDGNNLDPMVPTFIPSGVLGTLSIHRLGRKLIKPSSRQETRLHCFFEVYKPVPGR